MYRSLLDAVDVTGDDRYGSGRTQIFYFNKGLFSKFSRGTRGLDLNAVLADLGNTHTRIGRVNETDLSKIFNMMQGEVWSPNGEANTMPAMSKTGHTSMSIGDVIMLPNGSAYMVDFSGFTNLEDGAKKMASRNLTASDRSALIKLASSLPAGSPERKAILAGLRGSSSKTAFGDFNIPDKHIFHRAEVSDKAKVSDGAHVRDDAKLYDRAQVFDKAQVYDNAEMYDEAKVYGEAEVFGRSELSGKAKVYGNAEVSGKAIVGGDAHVYGSAQVYGDAIVAGDAKIGGTAVIIGGHWDGSEGTITSGKWKAPGVPYSTR